ncbi:sugar porter family MFS transporter [Mycolicibacter sp. MYC340]|uniref:Sugar porter family MFS transporter n=1 Tax=[Mycobacterium] nativiensis TaxID=2855503 RepID=A0ABU5Y379_9MYCO|nr:sugar porter family MFS transporter [Mycolicibacter sp. MYC340]MEB3033365.1 sugar porter family MFS transporter [Mycolicibacter sp. MYC340]
MRGQSSVRHVDELRTPRAQVLVALTAVSVGVIYGYDLSNIAGALRYITDEFHLSTHQQATLTVAVVIGQIAGALSGGLLANAIGRKKSLLLATAAYAVFAVLGALSASLPMLVVARLLLGVALGLSVVVVPVFVAESAPSRVRGSLLVADQLMTVVGSIAGYLVAYLLAGSQSWRWMLGLAAVPALLVMLALLSVPDTARWYLLKGRVDQARQALTRVEPEADVEQKLAEIAHAFSAEGGGVLAGMRRRSCRRAMAFVLGLGFFAHITGVNAVIYYGPTLFAEMGFQSNSALLGLPALAQAAALVAVVVSLLLVDRVGRRPVLLAGIATMIAANGVLIGAFASGSGFGAFPVLAFVGVLLFVAGFSFGFGGLLSVYAGESLPSRLRSMGSAALFTSELVATAIVAAVFLPMLNVLGGTATFAVFGLLALAAYAFAARFAPETQHTQLESIRHLWENRGARPKARSGTRAQACGVATGEPAEEIDEGSVV